MTSLIDECIYFTDYKVSTITCNADLGVSLNLDILYEYFTINDKFLLYLIYQLF